jgi:hypothetical protein
MANGMSAFHPLQTLDFIDKLALMRLARPTLMAVCAAAIFVAGCLIGSSLKSASSSATDEHPRWTEPQLRDAIHRWSLKSGQSEADIRHHRRPRAMFIPTRNQADGITCIELELERGSLGGSPVYCYQDDTGNRANLAAEYSDVE